MKKSLMRIILWLALALVAFPATGMAADTNETTYEKKISKVERSTTDQHGTQTNVKPIEQWPIGMESYDISAWTANYAVNAKYNPQIVPVEMITSKKTVSAYIEDTVEIKVIGYDVKSYSSDKTSVATVNQEGKVTAIKAGTAKIKITLTNKKIWYLTVKVSDPYKATGVTISDQEGTIVITQGFQASLEASMAPKTATNKLTWTSSNKSVAAVFSNAAYDKNCVIQGIKPGVAYVTVKTDNGKSCKVKIQVVANKVTLLSGKPGKSYIQTNCPEDDYDTVLKSIEIVRATSSTQQTKVVCQFYVMNRCFKKMTKISLSDMEIRLIYSDEEGNKRKDVIVSSDSSSKTQKVSIARNSCGLVTVTYLGDQINLGNAINSNLVELGADVAFGYSCQMNANGT